MLRKDMRIFIDNLTSYESVVNGETVTEYKHQLSNIIDYVTQYRFQGGPEQPIRYLEMKVDKNDIDLAHPHLIDSVVEGKTRLIIDAVDGGTFIITKIWLNQNSYDLVATGIEITLNTSTISSELALALRPNPDDQSTWVTDPPSIVKAIFDDWEETLHLSKDDGNYEEGSEKFDDDFRIYFSDTFALNVNGTINHEQPRGTGVNKISFKKDMPTLVAINMCALLDDAFVFIAGKDWVVNGVTKRINTLHYVSYEDILPLASNPGDAEKDGVINVYPGLTSQYINYSKFDLMMYQRLMGISSKNSEGSETIINQQIVSMDISPGGTYGEYSARSVESFAMYGDYVGAKVSSDLMISFEYNGTFTSKKIAENIVKRYKDPTRSITFELSEVINDTETGTSGWKGQISPFSYANKIVDSVNKITLTNTHLCDGTPDEFMLRLSTFIRSYPEMTTEYTFGVMKETTLSQELANKLTGMSGNVADVRVSGTSIAQNGIIQADTTPSSTAQTPDHLITSNGVYNAIQSAIGSATIPWNNVTGKPILWTVLGDLGSGYTMNKNDFNQAYPVRRKVNTFATNALSPDGANAGDYYLYSLGHTDANGYSTILAVTPRLGGNSSYTNLYIGHFWNGTWKGWHKLALTTDNVASANTASSVPWTGVTGKPPVGESYYVAQTGNNTSGTSTSNIHGSWGWAKLSSDIVIQWTCNLNGSSTLETRWLFFPLSFADVNYVVVFSNARTDDVVGSKDGYVPQVMHKYTNGVDVYSGMGDWQNSGYYVIAIGRY